MFRALRAAAALLLGVVLLGLPSVVEAQQEGPPPCTDPCHRPDGLLRRYSEATMVGDDIYNRDSAGQVRVGFVARESRSRFVVRAQNDGTAVDDLVVTGARNTTTFGIRYFVGSQEVSARVRRGIFRFQDVPPGGHRALTVEVQATARARVGDKVIARVALRSGAEPLLLDRVKPIVYRSRGAETPILGGTFTNQETAEQWARDQGASARFVTNARLYWELAPSRGVRPEVAYAQSAKETGYGNFGGVIDATFRNPCGLKTSAGGEDDDPDAHQRFASWHRGITACIDHLALYAGAPGYPRPVTPDPRHFPSVFGTARTVERLGAAWAPAPDYGFSIVEDYLNELLAT